MSGLSALSLLRRILPPGVHPSSKVAAAAEVASPAEITVTPEPAGLLLTESSTLVRTKSSLVSTESLPLSLPTEAKPLLPRV